MNANLRTARLIETYFDECTGAMLRPWWGFLELEVDDGLLATGKVGVRYGRGIFPDGTPFALPDDGPLPAPLEIAPQCREQLVHLAIPLGKSAAAREVHLLSGGHPRVGFMCMPMVRVVGRRADNSIMLDRAFIPTVQRCGVSPRLTRFLTELQHLLQYRGDSLAGRKMGLAELLMLQAVNRYEPLVRHFATWTHGHPEELYRLLLEIIGDLSTLTTAVRRPPALPGYRHDALQATFQPLIRTLRTLLAPAILQRPARSGVEPRRQPRQRQRPVAVRPRWALPA